MPPMRPYGAVLLAAALTLVLVAPAGAVTPNGRHQIIHPQGLDDCPGAERQWEEHR